MTEFDLSKIRELLKKQLEAKVEETERLPERFVFQEGQELFCRIKRIVDNPWREGSKLYIVEDLESGKLYRLPTHRVLEQELEGAKEGDIALIKLVRTYQKETEDGMRTVFVYRAAIYRQSESDSDDASKASYIEELFKIFNGEIPEDQFKYFIEDVRGWNAEEIIKEFNLKVENGVVKHG